MKYFTLKAEIRRENVIVCFMVVNLNDITLINPQYEYMYVDLCEAALNYIMQHYLLDSVSVCCISANTSIDLVLSIPLSSSSSSGGSGPVSNDVKQQQKDLSEVE